MPALTLLDKVKDSQRVTNTKVNTDYTELIAACKADLTRLGLKTSMIQAEGTEVTMACKLWVHWYTDYQSKGTIWEAAYHLYTDCLRMDPNNLEDTYV